MCTYIHLCGSQQSMLDVLSILLTVCLFRQPLSLNPELTYLMRLFASEFQELACLCLLSGWISCCGCMLPCLTFSLCVLMI